MINVVCRGPSHQLAPHRATLEKTWLSHELRVTPALTGVLTEMLSSLNPIAFRDHHSHYPNPYPHTIETHHWFYGRPMTHEQQSNGHCESSPPPKRLQGGHEKTIFPRRRLRHGDYAYPPPPSTLPKLDQKDRVQTEVYSTATGGSSREPSLPARR